MLTKNKSQQNLVMDRIGDWNPQLLREIKGRFKGRNIAIAMVISVLFQILLYFIAEAALPVAGQTYYRGRYCLEFPRNNPYGPCLPDAFGNIINWQLWWLDIFVWMSIIAILTLIVAGMYLIVADLSKEETRGTLDFIRMSPQSATNILIGKILGVPSLLYLAIIIALPLNLQAGLAGEIPLNLILTFYGIIIASCAFFYSAALLLGLVNLGIGSFKVWLGSIAVFLFLWLMTACLMSRYDAYGFGNPFDFLSLFHPGIALFYLVDATSLNIKIVRSLNIEYLSEFTWYGQALWLNAWTGMGLLFLNYALWTYWIWQGVKRSFDNPISTVFSKKQSYFISGIFSLILLGFTFQNNNRHYDSFDLFAILELLLVPLFLGLIAAISPHRQTLQDWARYRHQNSQKNSLINDLIWGEKSPSTLAIALNFVIAMVCILPGIIILPLGGNKMAIVSGLILLAGTIIILAAIAQLMLFVKSPKRTVIAAITIVCLTILPLAVLSILSPNPQGAPHLFLFTILPTVGTEYATATTVIFSVLSQWVAIALINFQMTKQLKKAGASETKALFAN